jgi:hypothetical protein
MDIVDPTDKTVDALMKLDLPAGVDVEIKLQYAIQRCRITPVTGKRRAKCSPFCFSRRMLHCTRCPGPHLAIALAYCP